MKDTLLIVDDEEDIRELLYDTFIMEGYDVRSASCAEEVFSQLEQNINLILLDINLPDMDGMEICKRIRKHISCPILFLTAKVEEQDRVNGFLVGADDYIVKPFHMQELKARVAAHLRREQRTVKKDRLLMNRELVIDYSSKTMIYQDQKIPLVKKEFAIIEFLSMNANQVFDKERIYTAVSGFDAEASSTVITEYIRRIREKMKKAGCKNYIETIWGVGYTWRR